MEKEKIIKMFDEYYHQGLSLKATSRGMHVCKTMRRQYLSGYKMNPETLMKFSVLLIHDPTFSVKDFREGSEIITEIENMIGNYDSLLVAEILKRANLLEDNPEYDEEKASIINASLELALERRQI